MCALSVGIARQMHTLTKFGSVAIAKRALQLQLIFFMPLSATT